MSDGISFSTAETNALSLGAGWNLASITSQAEQDFINRLLPSDASSRDHFFLGGTDANTEGVWQWLDGEAWTYDNWYSGESNDGSSAGNEDFVAMDFRSSWGGWNDIDEGNSLIRGYIVERMANVPEPGILSLLSLGLFGLFFNRRKRLQ